MRLGLGLMRVVLVCGVAVAAMLLFGHLGATRHVLDIQTPADTSWFHCFTIDIVLHIRESGDSDFMMYAGTPRALLWTRELGSDSLGPVLGRFFSRRPDKALRLEVDAAVSYGHMIQVIDVARGAGVKVFVLSGGGVCHPFRDAPRL